MEDNYLDKVFQDKLESSQHFNFDEAAWDDLATRLDNQPNRKIIPWQWLAAAGIVLPLLLSSAYFYQQLKETEKTVAKLEAQFDHLVDNFEVIKVEEPKTIAKSSTKTEVSVKPNISIEKSVLLRNESKTIAEKAISAINQTEIVAQAKTINENTITNNTNNKITEHKENSEIKNLENAFVFGENANYLDKIVYQSAKKSAAAVNKTPLANWIKQKKTLDIKESNWNKAKSIFIPVGFEIGAVYQSGVTLAQDLPLEKKPYFRTEGIRGAVNFVNNVDLTVGASYSTAAFQTQTIGQDFPYVAPTEPSDVFQRVVVSEKIVQVPIGIKYNFRNYDALFSPFVEIGAIAKKVIQKNHRYEYKPVTSNQEHYAITPKPQPISKSLDMNTLTGTVGITWNPNSKLLENFALQAEIFTAADVENIDTPTMVGVGINAKYMF